MDSSGASKILNIYVLAKEKAVEVQSLMGKIILLKIISRNLKIHNKVTNLSMCLHFALGMYQNFDIKLTDSSFASLIERMTSISINTLSTPLIRSQVKFSIISSSTRIHG